VKRVFILLVLCGGCLFCHALAQESDLTDPDTIPFDTIFHGWYANGIVERTALVINDTDAYLSAWDMIIQGVFPAPTAPSIDFETTTVLFVSSGVMPSGGYDVEIERIVAVEGGLEVHVLMLKPPEDATVTAALTQPYHGVALTKTGLPIRFEWETR